MVCALPAINTVADAFPGSNITLLTDEEGAGAELVSACSTISEVITYRVGHRQLGIVGLIRRLRRERFDLLVHLSQDRTPAARKIRDVFFFHLAGLSRQIGFDLGATMFWSGDRRIENPDVLQPNEVERLLRIVRKAGITPKSVRFGLRPGLEAVKRVDDLWALHGLGKQSNIIAVVPGSRMPCKRWPLSNYAEVCKRLLEREADVMLILGSKREMDLGEELVGETIGDLPQQKQGSIINLTGKTSLPECAEIVRRCKLYLGNDTGLMHLAAAMGTPCVAVFSGRDYPGAWHPYGSHHRILWHSVPCQPCFLTRCKNLICLAAIRPEAVLRACISLLSGTDGRCGGS
jgi:ADP-heptose:LPS heptosyltransferase